MTNLLDFTKALFGSSQMWTKITQEDKEAHYFIINRMFSKKYPEWSLYLSADNISKSSAMDTWHSLVGGRGYEAWFWKKSPSESKNNTPQFDRELMLKNDLSKLELESIKNLYPDEFEKMIKDLKKQKKEEGK